MLIIETQALSLSINGYEHLEPIVKTDKGDDLYKMELEGLNFLVIDWQDSPWQELSFYRYFEDNEVIPELIDYDESISVESLAKYYDKQFACGQYTENSMRPTYEYLMERFKKFATLTAPSFTVGYENSSAKDFLGHLVRKLASAEAGGDMAEVDKWSSMVTGMKAEEKVKISIRHKDDFMQFYQAAGYNFEFEIAPNGYESHESFTPAALSLVQLNQVIELLKDNGFDAESTTPYEWNDLDNHVLYLGEFDGYEAVYIDSQNEEFVVFKKGDHVVAYQCDHRFSFMPEDEEEVTLPDYVEDKEGKEVFRLREYVRGLRGPTPQHIGNNLNNDDQFMKLFEIKDSEYTHLDGIYDLALWVIEATQESLCHHCEVDQLRGEGFENSVEEYLRATKPKTMQRMREEVFFSAKRHGGIQWSANGGIIPTNKQMHGGLDQTFDVSGIEDRSKTFSLSHVKVKKGNFGHAPDNIREDWKAQLLLAYDDLQAFVEKDEHSSHFTKEDAEAALEEARQCLIEKGWLKKSSKHKNSTLDADSYKGGM